jgi:hypothetical protein
MARVFVTFANCALSVPVQTGDVDRRGSSSSEAFSHPDIVSGQIASVRSQQRESRAREIKGTPPISNLLTLPLPALAAAGPPASAVQQFGKGHPIGEFVPTDELGGSQFAK